MVSYALKEKRFLLFVILTKPEQLSVQEHFLKFSAQDIGLVG